MRRVLEIHAAIAGLTIWAGLFYLLWSITP